jgi:hypothetical protein
VRDDLEVYFPAMMTSDPVAALAQKIADRYATVPEVEAVAWAGSRLSHFADDRSDVDLYVYVSDMIPLAKRAELATESATTEIGNAFWEPGDEWVDRHTGLGIDVMFRRTPWIEDQLDRVLRRHEASIGYSTCFWYDVRNSQTLFDRTGWWGAIQKRARQKYPKELQRAIIAKNYPILRKNQSSYLRQIELALLRGDAVSVNHRVTALLASYFDILFALNEEPHPGEKRLAQFAQMLCPKLPPQMPEQIDKLLSSSGGAVLANAHAMLDGLDHLLRADALIP